MKIPFPNCWNIEGPLYADRVGGRLTFRDWDSWEEADKAEWREEYRARGPQPESGE